MAGRFRPFRPFPPILSSLALFLSLLFLCPPPRPMQEGPEPGSLGSWSIPFRAAPFLQCANAWYDTTSRREDMLGMNLPPLDKDIVPEKGVHIIKKIDRGDTLRIRQFNHIRALQHPDRDGQRALFLEMHSNAPVIGHLSPLSGPTAGGTRVHVWGTNFAGGDIYKCRFGSKGIVSAEYNNTTGTITCIAPAFMDVASKNYDVPFTVVIFNRRLCS